MSIRISIVIPFYNVEKYIAECLDSVFNQDIPEEEYEVICVNDASPDGSRDIVLEYQEKHQNLILVEHEVNKKLGAARNTGRRIARGKYLWNVDSDDILHKNCLKEILDICDKNDLDVLLFCFDLLKGGEIEGRIRPWKRERPCTGIEFWEQQVLHNQTEISQVWTQVYRRAYLDSAGIFSPEINMSEDEPYTYSSIIMAKRIMSIPESFYIARQHSDSLTRVFRKTPSSDLLYDSSFASGRVMYDTLSFIPSEHKMVRENILSVLKYKISSALEVYDQMTDIDKKSFKKRCRKDFFRNLFAIKVLSRRQALNYLSFLFV